MRIEKIDENLTKDSYKVTLVLIEGDSNTDTIYGNIYGLRINTPTAGICSRVKLYWFGRLLTDTFPRDGVKLEDLISEVLKENKIEIE